MNTITNKRAAAKCKSSLGRIVIAIICAAVMAAIGIRLQPSRSDLAKSAAWREQVSGLRSALLGQHSVEAEKTVARIRTLVRNAEKNAPRQATQASAPFLGFRNTAGNVWMVAWDKGRGTHHFQDRAVEALQPALCGQAELAWKIAAELKELDYTMSAADNRFRQQVLQLGAKAGFPPSELTLDDKAFQEMLQTQRHATVQVAGASVATAMELVLIRSTVESFRALASAAIARLSGTAASAGTAAVADGPLPIGDIVGAIIAIGGSAWTIWDIRHAAEEMHKLQPTIQAQILAAARKLEQDALRRVETMTAAHATVAKIR